MRAWFGVLLSVSLLAGCQNLPAIFTSDTSGPPPDYVNVLRTGNVLIQLVPRAPQAPPNNHPAAFAPEQLHALLMSLRIRSEGEGAVTLASPSRLTSVAEGLAKAFARARPDQDIFLVFFRRKAGNLMFSSHRQATSARVFFRNDTLQFIFDELDHYFSSFRGPQTNELEPGRRDTAQGVKGARLVANSAWRWHGDRRDWIEMDATPAAIAAAAQAAPPVTSQGVAKSAQPLEYGPAAARPADQIQEPTADLPASPQAAEAAALPVPMAAPTPVPVRDDATAAAWAKIEKRLTVLKRLREQGLITQQDYEKKKEELLVDLP